MTARDAARLVLSDFDFCAGYDAAAAAVYAHTGVLMTADDIKRLVFQSDGLAVDEALRRRVQGAAGPHYASDGTNPPLPAGGGSRTNGLSRTSSAVGAGGKAGGGSQGFIGSQPGQSKWTGARFASQSPVCTSAGGSMSGVPPSSPLPSAAQVKQQLKQTVAYAEGLYGADVFKDPVPGSIRMTHNQSYLGPYSEVVYKPACMSDIATQVDKGRIASVAAFEAQALLMGANCVMFNAPEGDYPPMARAFVGSVVAETGSAL